MPSRSVPSAKQLLWFKKYDLEVPTARVTAGHIIDFVLGGLGHTRSLTIEDRVSMFKMARSQYLSQTIILRRPSKSFPPTVFTVKNVLPYTKREFQGHELFKLVLVDTEKKRTHLSTEQFDKLKSMEYD